MDSRFNAEEATLYGRMIRSSDTTEMALKDIAEHHGAPTIKPMISIMGGIGEFLCTQQMSEAPCNVPSLCAFQLINNLSRPLKRSMIQEPSSSLAELILSDSKSKRRM